jgi:hypothetical protein
MFELDEQLGAEPVDLAQLRDLPPDQPPDQAGVASARTGAIVVQPTQPWGEDCADGAGHRNDAGLASSPAALAQTVIEGLQMPEPLGLVLLHPGKPSAISTLLLFSTDVCCKVFSLVCADMSGFVAPKYMRVLANSRLGRRVLRSLLRTEVGEVGALCAQGAIPAGGAVNMLTQPLFTQVANRRAWADPKFLTPDLLQLYRRALHVQGWDTALIEVSMSS